MITTRVKLAKLHHAVNAAQQLTGFVEGHDADDHFAIQGELKLHKIINCDSSIHCCKFHPNGDIFACGLSDGSIKIYKKSNGQLLYTLIDDEVKLARLPVTCIKFYNPNESSNRDHYNILVATYISGYVKFWHFPSKACVFSIEDKQVQPLCVDFNASFDKIAVGGYSNQIHVYDVASKKLVNVLESSGDGLAIDGHSSRVYCVKYHPLETHQMFSGGWDDTVQVWDDRIANSQRFIYGPHVCGSSLDIDTKYNHLLAGSWRKSSSLQIWDLRNYELIRDVFKNKSTAMIYSCQWVAKSLIFTCGSERNSAVVYDRGTLNTHGALSELKYAVTSIDNDNNGDFPMLLATTHHTCYLLRSQFDLANNSANKS